MRLIGVDLGGTKTEIAVTDASAGFETVFRERVPTPLVRGYDAIVRVRRSLGWAVRPCDRVGALGTWGRGRCPAGSGAPGT
ncbi:MAG: hypothetical protein U0414_25350 [Polyangiaceae bacterium]